MVVVELGDGRERWTLVGRLLAAETPVSMSDHASGVRQIVQIECDRDGWGLVQQSIGGTDAELAEGKLRAIATFGWRPLARLAPGQEYSQPILTDGMKDRGYPPLTLRVRCVDGA